ncbi:hypothetical protein F5Y19DRAFT_422412, partial [Xylariaceae sp. FL1651]
MDPLSIVSSIVWLLTAAAKLHSLLEYISSAKNAPASIHEAHTEVKHVELALRSLQRYLWGFDPVDAKRKQLISIGELTVSLADAMVAISEFESFLRPLARLKKIELSILWLRYTRRIEKHTMRAQRHKASLTMMLNILQCESDLEASQCQERLQILVETILTENKDLKTRLGQLEDMLSHLSTPARRMKDNSTARFSCDNNFDNTSTKGATDCQGTIVHLEKSEFRFAFESVLEQSRVYQRNDNNQCDCSLISSARQSRSWSTISGYSLAIISVLSVFGIPITAIDIANKRRYEPEAVESLSLLDESNEKIL